MLSPDSLGQLTHTSHDFALPEAKGLLMFPRSYKFGVNGPYTLIQKGWDKAGWWTRFVAVLRSV